MEGELAHSRDGLVLLREHMLTHTVQKKHNVQVVQQ